MSTQRVCDACTEPITDGQSFYSVTAQKQSSTEGQTTIEEPQQGFDFHVEHLPWEPPPMPEPPAQVPAE